MALAFLLMIWGFYYLLYFPGCASTDSNDILKMALGLPFDSNHFRYNTLNDHHPFLYTSAVEACVQFGRVLGSITLGVGIFTLVQMLLLASACAWSLTWLYRRTDSRVALCLTAAFFMLNPLIARYAVTVWKDVPFAGVMLLFSIVVLEIALSKGKAFKQKKWFLAFIFLLASILLLRSNGILVGVFVAVILAFFCPFSRREILGASGSVVVGVLLLQNVIFGAVGIAPAHFSESVSLPLQQIARSVVDGGEMTEAGCFH